ncbi:MAG: hypothetical protein KME15_07180 [Drouetiella hepatica Uher 2000/2452]|uniref:Uncharacterized protein n=1 Tax=Drouetiella hepatica Uher 2000/2452 TaxID=904376 RepID=A0A951Q9F5_9CYAN|nr:hypothetical protein [Drouetiella hepatica Uher 2000/2452]
MQDSFQDAAVEVAELLKRFSFDLGGLTAEQLVFNWLAQYPANWVRLSLVEALYQGRYKAVSVEQILRFWQRRGQPFYHFNYEFERMIRGHFSRNLLSYSTAVASNTHAQVSVLAKNDAGQTAGSETISEAIKDTEIRDTQESSDTDPKISELNQGLMPELYAPEEFSAIVDVIAVSAANPSSDEAEADLLTFTDPATPAADLAASAIQPFSDRLKLLSSEESIAFLKLRSFENDTPFYPLPKDAPIQAFSLVPEFEAVDKPKWAKLAIDGASAELSSAEPPSTNQAPPSAEPSAIDESSPEKIHQFIPAAVSPLDFYSKLKAVACESGKADRSSPLPEDEGNS